MTSMPKEKNLDDLCNDIILKSQEKLGSTNIVIHLDTSEVEVLRDNISRNESSILEESPSILQSPEPVGSKNFAVSKNSCSHESLTSLDLLSDSEDGDIADDFELKLEEDDEDASRSESSCSSSAVNALPRPKLENNCSLDLEPYEQLSEQLSSDSGLSTFHSPSETSDSTLNNNNTRLYEKKHVSASEFSPRICHPSSSTLSSQYSPSSKSVMSMPSFSLNPKTSSTSWIMSSFSRKKKKKSLTALLDALHPSDHQETPNTMPRKHKSDQNLSSLLVKPKNLTSVPNLPRSNSTSGHDKRQISRSKFCQDTRNGEEDKNSSMHLSRLATTDLRNLEARERMCQSTEILDETELVISNSSRREGRKPSPHPQAYFTVDSRNLHPKHKRSMKDKKHLYGIKQFNLEPKRGINFLIESGFLEENNPKSVAQFLFREARLSKRQIGNFIGGHEEFNCKVLQQFVKCHEFTHLILVQALRQFLWSFRLPGEAMQIDRIMEAFATRYCEQNPNLFEDTDTCYIISFSIIMLNTDLHNPNVKQKISIDQFVKQNQSINGGLPRDILEIIYKTIKEEPFKIPNETYDDLMYTFFSPEKEGWLMKQGGSWKNWKRRWFVLSDRCLYYFQHTAENVPKGIIPLENVKVRQIDDMDGKSYCFEVYSESNSVVKGCKTDSKGTVVQGNHKTYKMSASSKDERTEWINNLQSSIMTHPFHTIINSKKASLRRKQQLRSQQQNLTPIKKRMPSHYLNSSNTSCNSTPNTPKKKTPALN